MPIVPNVKAPNLGTCSHNTPVYIYIFRVVFGVQLGADLGERGTGRKEGTATRQTYEYTLNNRYT